MGQPVARKNEGLVTAGYVSAALLPPLGVLVGLALINKGRGGHGLAVIILSAVIVGAAVAVVTLDGSCNWWDLFGGDDC
jgi:hypothetical protein